MRTASAIANLRLTPNRRAVRVAARWLGKTLAAASLVPIAWCAAAKEPVSQDDLWSLQPIKRTEVPRGFTASKNPIDAFIARACREKGVEPFGPADRLAWLRRVTFDLTGLPPTVAEQDAFLADDSPSAFAKVADRLLASEQYGVRYGRHWLDVLRFTDADEDLPAAPGIHLWRDWVIHALNTGIGCDEFARAQILGHRGAQRRKLADVGHMVPVEPRPEDQFALGFLARGATTAADTDQALAFTAVETVSSAFLGITVACAKCHDHFYDPVKQADYYSMKALFDPLVLRRIDLATPAQLFEQGRKVAEYEARLNVVTQAMHRFLDPYRTRLQEERIGMLPPEAQAAIRKPEKQRTAAEQRLFVDYSPILRIDSPKYKAVMTPEEIKRYDEFLRQARELKEPEPLPVFWTVAEDAKRAAEPSYVLTTGDIARPRKDQPVQPGFPFAPSRLEFREGRREEFADWLTAPENPLFARVAVNRIWQWHFGTGLHPVSSDFGVLGGKPIHPKLLDWLASEFTAQEFSMKWLHHLIVTSDTYRRASAGPAQAKAANSRLDPENKLLWKFPLRRLEAEPVRDALLACAGTLDLTVGGKSFEADQPGGSNRRAAYMSRGYRQNADAMPDFLQTFDAEDGRSACPRRTSTVTAPQALFLMNNELIEDASAKFAQRLRNESIGDLEAAITLGYRVALGRPPGNAERAKALAYVQGDPARLKGLAWLLFNLDEFLFVR